MQCNRCNRSMTELKRSFHKQRKWRCGFCGRVRFQQAKPRNGSRKSYRKLQ